MGMLNLIRVGVLESNISTQELGKRMEIPTLVQMAAEEALKSTREITSLLNDLYVELEDGNTEYTTEGLQSAFNMLLEKTRAAERWLSALAE